MTGGSLRERRKNETRTIVLEAALDLFEERGFEQTTIEDIAARAGISARTFFRYFESKNALVLHGGHDEDPAHKDDLVEAIIARPATESPSEALAAAIHSQLGEAFADDGLTLRQLRVVINEPTLRRLAQDSFHDHRPDLARAFAVRLGAAVDDLGPRVLAAAFTEVIWVILERWTATGGGIEQLPQMIDEAFASLGSGLG